MPLSVLLLAMTVFPSSLHPIVDHALDVVIERDRVVVDIRVAREQILLVEANPNAKPTDEEWTALADKHGRYLIAHIRVRSDGATLPADADYEIEGAIPDPDDESPDAALVSYTIEYPVHVVPHIVEIEHDFLKEYEAWTASCVLRIRQVNQSEFELALLPRDKTAEYVCEWLDGTATAAGPISTRFDLFSTISEYTWHGIMHILTGYDHLLFVSALVLAAQSLWDLVKVVTAFTLAHTSTLILSIFEIVTLSERIVEPMIAASIVFVAIQNVTSPQNSRGWTRPAIAFAFGLFHGLGFAGGLRDAMADLPSIALWVALISFSLGVEIGHQIVVIPLYTVLRLVNRLGDRAPKLAIATRTRHVASVLIALAGTYYFYAAVR